jgi:serine/threonine-protein kinase
MMSSTLQCPNGHPVGSADAVCPVCGTLPYPETVPLPTGPVLPAVPGYELLGLLGRGGMGVVYKARQTSLNRLVALKMIRDSALAGPAERKRFRHEAEAVAQLQHPNIVQVYEIGEQDGLPFFSLEFVPGGNLAEQLRGKPQPPRAAAGTAETLARAVHAAHQRDIIHRDLKPANVLLTEDGTPKIADFGLAKRVQGDSGREAGLPAEPPATGGLTGTGVVVGTPSYMAPEQAEGKKEVGTAADVYALGAILYECLTGRPPFLGETSLDTLQQVLSQEPVPPRQLQPKVPRDLETVCLKCLQKEPGQRYASALDLADDLARFLAGQPIRARPVSPWLRLGKWARRRPAVAALVAVSILSALVLTTGGLVYNAWLRQAVQRAESNEAEARREHALASERYRDASATLGRILNRLEGKNRADAPTLKELREALLQDNLAFYQKVIQQADDRDPEVRLDTAQAYRNLAAIQQELGQPGPAVENLRRCVALLEELPPEYRDSTEALIALGNCHTRLGVEALGAGRVEDGKRHYLSARDLFERVVRRHPDSPEQRFNLAGAEDNLANVMRQTNQPVEPHYRRAIDIREALVRDYPGARIYQAGLAESYQNLGVYCMQNNQRAAEAAACYGKAEALLRPLTEKYPDESTYGLALAATYLNWSYLLAPAGQAPVALVQLGRAVDLAEAALQREPRDAAARDQAYRAHARRAEVYEQVKRPADAIQDWDRVVALTEEANRWRPRMTRALALARAGQHARVAAEARAVAEDPAVGDDGLWGLALACSRSVEAAQADTRLATAERDALAERYAVQAVGLLRKLEARGAFNDWRNALGLRTEPALGPLRQRADFQKLLEDNYQKLLRGNAPKPPSQQMPAKHP